MASMVMAEVEVWDFLFSMLLRCAYSLCACGHRICKSELLMALLMLREGEHPDGIDDLG